ncbi:TetR/AcrR family transcriptional regulator [Isoptericola sp. NEAU-Y5]|uniref:TetR/AcrR family transcriptional regulator n=1 Tax=Isoptericola luteus TaxID=2879484 RepID=A0ABS7ZGQ2_9MICO|nr:TetR/AcrR family transcriptional regulator [Isoptericola sp. NEAU-Y5]MCA5893677.1 TetR/AcrR family transcriptional regulator [Isoptericola sp. NEAU-Y5]
MATLTAHDWVRAAARRLAADGVDAVRVEPLAKELGVSKGSFYWHFPDRAALLGALLVYWRDAGTAGVITQVEQAAGDDPARRLHRLVRLAFAHADRGFDGAVRAWAAREERARTVVQEIDEVRVAYLVRLLTDAEAPQPELRAAVVYRTLLGEYAMRHAGSPALREDAVDALADWALSR